MTVSINNKLDTVCNCLSNKIVWQVCSFRPGINFQGFIVVFTKCKDFFPVKLVSLSLVKKSSCWMSENFCFWMGKPFQNSFGHLIFTHSKATMYRNECCIEKFKSFLIDC